MLFSGSKRVTLKPEDMTTEKISVIFQVCILLKAIKRYNITLWCLNTRGRAHTNLSNGYRLWTFKVISVFERIMV